MAPPLHLWAEEMPPCQAQWEELGVGAGDCVWEWMGGPRQSCPVAPTCGPSLTHGRADAVALGVDEAPDLGEVAVPLGDVLDGGGLHEQRVVGRQRPLDAFLVVLHQRRGLAAHEGPHLLEGGDLGFLGRRGG